MEFKSNRKNVQESMDKATLLALTTIGVAGDSWITAETPVGVYDDGRVGGNLKSSNSHSVHVDEKSVTFENNAEYAIWVHEGSSRNTNKQPFIRRPIESRGSDLQSLAERAFRSVFK